MDIEMRLTNIRERQQETLARLDRLEGMLAYWFWRTYTNQGLSSRIAEEEACGVDILKILQFPEDDDAPEGEAK